MGLVAAAVDTHSSAYQTGALLGLVALAATALVLGLRALDRKGQHDVRYRRRSAIAALVVAVLLVGGIVRNVREHDAGPWDSQRGRTMHAGFIDGCHRSSGGVVDCECVFDHLTSEPPYDTPEGFMGLGAVQEAAARTGDPSTLPPQVLNALLSCRT